MLEIYRTCGNIRESYACAMIAGIIGECGICGWIRTNKDKKREHENEKRKQTERTNPNPPAQTKKLKTAQQMKGSAAKEEIMKGIDVAKWNGGINWLKVKNAGVEFVILKVIDKKCSKEEAFERNYAGASAQGIPVDVYNYSYATTVEKAKSDADVVVSIIKARNVKTVWLDVEDSCQQGLGSMLADIVNAYKEIIAGAGFGFGVYTGLSFYNSYIKPHAGTLDCPFWIARYPVSTTMEFSRNPSENKKPVISHTLNGWQYTSNGRVDGITGSVDLSIWYDGQSSAAASGAGTVASKYTGRCGGLRNP